MFEYMEIMMNHPLDLDSFTKATRRREFDDGLMDYATGGIFLTYCLIAWFLFSPAGLEWYIRAIINYRTITIVGLIGLEVLLLIGMVSVRRIIEHVRISRIWKDSGYVKPLQIQTSWPVILSSVVITLGMVLFASWLQAVGTIDLESVLRTLVSSTGIATGVIYIGVSITLDINRYLIVGLLGGMISLLILFLPLSFSMAWLILGIAWTIILVISGTRALKKVLSANKGS